MALTVRWVVTKESAKDLNCHIQLFIVTNKGVNFDVKFLQPPNGDEMLNGGYIKSQPLGPPGLRFSGTFGRIEVKIHVWRKMEQCQLSPWGLADGATNKAMLGQNKRGDPFNEWG